MSLTQYDETILSATGDDENDIFMFYFVQRESGMSNTMQLAYEATKERFSDPESIIVMSNEECLNQPKSSLKEKRKYYIFDDFDMRNNAFKYISDAKNVYILGPRAILSILLEHLKTTSGSYHMHNLSMRGFIITSTNLSKEKKNRIKELVTYMGASYSDHLEKECTHLISETVRSQKYEVASVNQTKVMHPNWVEKVWEKSQKLGNIPADDPEFDCFLLPCFNGVCFTSTGLTTKERDKLKNLIEENGGQYNATFNNSIDMLLMEASSIGTLKYNHAIRLKKICLTPAWVYDSLKIGYALRLEKYIFEDKTLSVPKPIKISTPTKENTTINKFYPDSTMLSDLSRITTYQRNDSIDETMRTVASSSSRTLIPASREQNGLVQQISIKAAKVAGTVLDGFCFYMSGFSTEELRHLGKVLGILGATKVDTLDHQISHVLVNEVNPELFEELANLDNELSIVKIDWIKTMIEQKQLVNEEEFLVEQPARRRVALEKPSPASKKAIERLNGTFKKPIIPKLFLDGERDVEENVNMVNQYLNPSTSSESSYNHSRIVKFLTGKNIFVYGCSSSEESMEIIEKVEELGATLVDATFKNTVDYIITPNVSATSFDHGIKKFKHLVNMLWLVESAEAGSICDVLFYHKPLVEYTFGSEELPLGNEKIAVTNYKGNSRTQIESLVKALGGEYSETLRKSDNAILISPDAVGKKSQSAKDWNFTIIKAEWLVECYEKRRRVNEIPFLVGGTNPSKKNIENEEDSVVLSSQDVLSSSHRFNSFDPQVENFDDDDPHSTPKVNRVVERLKMTEIKTPSPSSEKTSQYVSEIINGMPTPVREITRAVLLEANAPNSSSPRRKRFQEITTTPGNKIKNISLETPELLRAPLGDFVLRPNASPESQWHQKRKLEGLDNNYVPQPKKFRIKDIPQETPTPPYSHRRHDFYKACLSNYDSPDPRTSTDDNKKDETPSEATKFLNFDDDTEFQGFDQDNETLKEFQEFEKRKKLRNEQNSGPRKTIRTDEPASSHTEQMHPAESEVLVEWNYTQSAHDRDTVNPFVFETSTLNTEENDFVMKELEKLGCEKDSESYTHMITKSPNRGEKYFSSIASGCFVIHIDYVKQCTEANRLLKVDQFEFGNPLFKPSLKNIVNESNELMFNAPYKWRNWIKYELKELFKDGAFTGKTYTIVDSKGKRSLFNKVVNRGGGKLVDLDFDKTLPMSMLKGMNIDYCLIADGKAGIGKLNTETLRACGIKIVNIKFLCEFLTSSDPLNYLHQQL